MKDKNEIVNFFLSKNLLVNKQIIEKLAEKDEKLAEKDEKLAEKDEMIKNLQDELNKLNKR